jgi:Rieske 2Fe-2S family protein
MNVDKTAPFLEQTENSLPKHFYIDEDHYKRELDAIWFKHWLYVCRSEALENKGDYQVLDVGGQSIIVIRGKEGAIHAFHNTCRHRGSILTTESKGCFKGGIVCPYHAWTYAVDGRLTGTPRQLKCDDFDKKDYPLFDVGVEEWDGFVFVCLNPEEAPPLHEGLEEKSFISALKNWGLSDLRSGFQSRKVLNCNWKIFQENFAECFHCPGVHPEFCDLVPIYGKALLGGDSEALENHKANPGNLPPSGFRPGAKTWSMDGKSNIPRFPNVTDEDVAEEFRYFRLNPGLIIEALSDVVSVVRIIPLAPEKTEVVSELLFHPSVIGKYDDDIKSIIQFLDLVMEQDCGICEVNQKGMHSNRFQQGILVPQEYAVHNFQQWVLSQLSLSK